MRPVAGRLSSPSTKPSTSSTSRVRSGAQRVGSSASRPSTVADGPRATRAIWSGGSGGVAPRSMPRSAVSPMRAAVATRSRRQKNAAAPAIRRTAPTIKSRDAGGAIQARAQIPRAKATASGASGTACQAILVADGDEIAERGQLPRPEPQDVPETLGRVEAAPPLALLDDATGQARAHTWKPRDLLHARVIQVERSGIRHGLGLDGGHARPSRSGHRWRSRRLGSRRGRPARRGSRTGLGRDGRRRVFTIEALQALGQLREPRAPFAHAEPHEEDPREEKKEPEL